MSENTQVQAINDLAARLKRLIERWHRARAINTERLKKLEKLEAEMQELLTTAQLQSVKTDCGLMCSLATVVEYVVPKADRPELMAWLREEAQDLIRVEPPTAPTLNRVFREMIEREEALPEFVAKKTRMVIDYGRTAKKPRKS